MRDVLPALLRVWTDGGRAGLATVTSTWDSAPRPAGAAMLVDPAGAAVGSVSGGCVEAAVYEECRAAAADGTVRLRRYGVTDDDALEAGLPCGGSIELLIEPVDRNTVPHLDELAGAVAAGTPVALLTGITGRPGAHLVVTLADRFGSLGSERADAAAVDDARGLLAAGRTAVLTYGPDGQRRGTGLTVLVQSFAPPPRMLVFGATDHAAALARIGGFLGYRVTVCDARPVFATRARFPDADEVVVAWPDRYLTAEHDAGRLDARTVVCVLTHDQRFDVPVLVAALRMPLGYVGAMGSRRTHDDRRKRLAEAGLDEAALDRLASPIGLDLGARTPEETAVSIAAELVARRWGGTGEPLSGREGPVHRDRL